MSQIIKLLDLESVINLYKANIISEKCLLAKLGYRDSLEMYLALQEEIKETHNMCPYQCSFCDKLNYNPVCNYCKRLMCQSCVHMCYYCTKYVCEQCDSCMYCGLGVCKDCIGDHYNCNR